MSNKISRGVSCISGGSAKHNNTTDQRLRKSRLSRIQSHDHTLLSKSEKSGVQIVDPSEWLLWCEENKVIGSSNSIPLQHHEIECFRRYFDSLKLHASDDGVHPQTIADSLLHAEIFPTLNDALNFAQKLRSGTESYVTYADILAATQCRSNYKRGKVRAYIKFVATSELVDFTSSSEEVGAGREKNALCVTDLTASSRGDLSKHSSFDFGSPTAAPHSADFAGHFDHSSTIKTVDILSEKNGRCSGAMSSSKELIESGTAENTPENFVSVTSEPTRSALAEFVSNATDRIGSLFNKAGSTPPLTQNPKPRSSGESMQTFNALKKYFSRSYSRSPVASTYEPNKSESVFTNNTNKFNVVALTETGTGTKGEGKKLPSPPSTSPKSPKSKLAIRPVLKKMDSGETRIAPKVKFKRAAMKIYVADRLIHIFREKNCRVAAGFVDSDETAEANHRYQETVRFADAAGLDSKEIFGSYPDSSVPTDTSPPQDDPV